MGAVTIRKTKTLNKMRQDVRKLIEFQFFCERGPASRLRRAKSSVLSAFPQRRGDRNLVCDLFRSAAIGFEGMK